MFVVEQHFEVTLKDDWINLIQYLYETQTNNDIGDDGILRNGRDVVDTNGKGTEEDDAIATTEHKDGTAKETYQSEDHHSHDLMKDSGILENRGPLAFDENADIDKGVVEENQSPSKLSLLTVSSIDTNLELNTQPNAVHRSKQDRIETWNSR